MEKCDYETRNLKRTCTQNAKEDTTVMLIKKAEEYRTLYKILNQWLTLKERNVKLQDYFEEKGFYKIMIYGMQELGKHLYEEIENGQLEVVGALDCQQELSYKEVKVYNLEGKIPKCDVIVVTAIQDYGAIKRILQAKADAKILSLVNIINELAMD